MLSNNQVYTRFLLSGFADFWLLHYYAFPQKFPRRSFSQCQYTTNNKKKPWERVWIRLCSLYCKETSKCIKSERKFTFRMREGLWLLILFVQHQLSHGLTRTQCSVATSGYWNHNRYQSMGMFIQLHEDFL